MKRLEIPYTSHYGLHLVRRLTLYLVVCACFGVPKAFAQAEDWSADGVGQYPPEAPADRIIKWCSADGTQVRYASANLKISGFQPCGKLETTATCDASGNRLLSKDDTRPNGHLDCSVGPRLLIINRGEEDTVDQTNMAQSSDSITPLSAEEKNALNREMKKAEVAASNDPAVQLQMLTNSLLQGFLGVQTPLQQNRNTSYSRRGKSRAQNARDQRRILEETLKNVDPQTKKLILQMLQAPPQRPKP